MGPLKHFKVFVFLYEYQCLISALCKLNLSGLIVLLPVHHTQSSCTSYSNTHSTFYSIVKANWWKAHEGIISHVYKKYKYTTTTHNVLIVWEHFWLRLAAKEKLVWGHWWLGRNRFHIRPSPSFFSFFVSFFNYLPAGSGPALETHCRLFKKQKKTTKQPKLTCCTIWKWPQSLLETQT